MGLKLTLTKENNGMYCDFPDAYWKIDNVGYTTSLIGGTLLCFPSREASKINRTPIEEVSLKIGTSFSPCVDSCLYIWNFENKISNVFPEGIPLDEDEQKTIIYNWIKSYTGLPFEDVFEEEN